MWSWSAGRAALLVLGVVGTVSCSAGSALAAREIPVGLYDVNDAQGHEELPAERMYAIRFVVDQPTTVYRFFSGFNLEGVYTDGSGAAAPSEIRTRCLDKRTRASCPESFNASYQAPPASLPRGWSVGTGRVGYAHGDGGSILARLVTMNIDGTPDLSSVIAEETFNPVDRYSEIKANYGITGKSGMLYANFGGASLQADTPYFVVYKNVAREPLTNFVSFNSPVTNASVAGPNGTNTLEANATGAIAGLDPREAVAWSLDDGLTWGWGHEVGSGSLFGDYVGSGDSDVKLPWYAWQPRALAPLESNQPYYAYTEAGEYTLSVTNGSRAATVTEAGGYAPVGFNVGVVTVTAASGSATTASLGSGLQHGTLSQPLLIAPGETFTISNVDPNAVREVAKAEGDGFLQQLGLVGSGKPYATAGNGFDRAELFVLPHPLFGDASASSYYETVMATGGLQSYWRLEETRGTTASDEKRAVSGTYTSATLGAPGLIGTSNPAVSFSGTRNRMYATGYGFSGTSSFTIEAVVKPTTVDATSRRVFSSEVISRETAVDGFGLWNNGTLNKLQVCRIPGGSYDCATTTALSAGTAAHLAATYDGTTLKLYVNGSSVASTTSRGSITTPEGLSIGSRADLGGGAWAGTIDEVAVYNRALTETQIEAHAVAAGY